LVSLDPVEIAERSGRNASSVIMSRRTVTIAALWIRQ